MQVFVGSPVLYRRAGTGGLDFDIGTVLGHHHLGLHIGAFGVELLVVVGHLDRSCLGQPPGPGLLVQPLKKVVELVHADGLPDGEYLLLRVLDQDNVIRCFNHACSLHTEYVRLDLVNQPLLPVQLLIERQPPLPQTEKQLGVVQGQQCPDLSQGKAVALEPLNAHQVGQLLLPVVAVAVVPHLLGAQQSQRVVVAQHPGCDPAQPGKITDGQHDIPPEFIVGTGS